MIEIPLHMPKMGEGVIEVTVLRWIKKEGEYAMEGESILEVATDKVDAEVPAAYSGTIKELLVKEGKVVAIGTPIAIITTNQDIAKSSHIQEAPIHPTSSTYAKHIEAPTQNPHSISHHTDRSSSPLVSSIARQAGITLQELEGILGTAKDGRITKQDILNYLNKNKQQPNKSPYTDGIEDISLSLGDEVVPMGRVRKLIAARMVASKQIAPHVTSFISADVTNLVAWRDKNKMILREKTSISLTYTPVFIEAIAKSLKQFPLINASIVGDNIITKKAINIGLAVALPDGNLIVPVVKHADQLSFIDLAKKIQDLVYKARNQQLVPDDLAGATYTVSNIGSFKNLMGTPIIMQPQVAILALGAIVKKPAVVTTEQGDTIAIRHEMFLSHTYDHRVIDGALGGLFLKEVVRHLEEFDTARSI